MKQTIFSTTLDNGIVLLGEELPGLESVAIAFHTPAGAVHDGPGRCGLATLSGEMMLRYMGWTEAADAIITAMDRTIGQKTVTYDFARLMEGATEVKCSEFADALIRNL